MKTNNNAKNAASLFGEFDVYGRQYSYEEMKVVCVLSKMRAIENLDYEDLMYIAAAVYWHWANQEQIEEEVFEEYPWLATKSFEEEGYVQAYASRVLSYFIEQYVGEVEKPLRATLDITKEKRLKINKSKLIDSLESYEVVCDNCACNEGDENGKQLMRNAAITIKELMEENERYKAIPEQLHKEMSEKMAEEIKIERKLTIRRIKNRLHEELRMYGPKDKFNKEFFLGKTDKVAEELMEGVHI